MNSIHFRKLSPCMLAPRLGNGFATVASKFAAVTLPLGGSFEKSVAEEVGCEESKINTPRRRCETWCLCTQARSSQAVWFLFYRKVHQPGFALCGKVYVFEAAAQHAGFATINDNS